MRTLLLNTKDGAGGAGIAARRLLGALRHIGVEADLLVRDRETDLPHIHTTGHRLAARAAFLMERCDVVRAQGGSRSNLFAIDPATRGLRLDKSDLLRRADVVHLHWVNQGFLSLGGLRRLLACGKGVVWTMHDMWPVTGICHHSEACRHWIQECHDCRLLRRPAAQDLSWRTFLEKRSTYARGRISFVAPSDWLADIARRSPLTEGCPVHSIPNPIDTTFYAPGREAEVRERLGIPADHRVLLFAAYKATDEKKGTSYVKAAVQALAENSPELRGRLHVIIVGREAETLREAFPCPAHCFEYVSEETVMRDLYRAADVLLMPTLMDNLPNTVVEAMACGTPCVAFSVGGLPQMIDHGRDGYLARYRDEADFLHGIRSLLLADDYAAIARAARESALRNYAAETVARRYQAVYEEALSHAACTKNPNS